MITKDIRPGATPQGLTGVTKNFTIEANGIAFRSMIDSLYTNKVRAVIRELCSNALDSHIEAGQTRPFTVQIPTALDPVFSVRDYGVGLSHDDVMGLYTTIFQSSKRNTNEQTGQLGLGSKSPFAYTDSFTVRAYDGNECRVYLAHLATDGIPALTHAATVPSNDPRGLEVTFAAKREDVRRFQQEMQFVAMAYTESMPEVLGMTVKIAPPRLKGDNWAIFPRGAFGDDYMPNNHFIKMGSALYPSQTYFPHVGQGWITITEIPIGAASVTSSRDALSYDDETSEAVADVHQSAYEELRAQVDAILGAAKTRVEKAKVYKEYNGVLDNLRGYTSVPLWKDEVRGTTGIIPGDVLEMAAHFGKSYNARNTPNRWSSQFEVATLDRLLILVNDGENPVVRRTKRIRNAGHQLAYVINEPLESTQIDIAGVPTGKITHPRAEAIAWVKACLELTDAQFRLVSTLPDDPPVRSPRQAGPKVKRVLKPGQAWLVRADGIVQTEHYGWSARGPGNWPGRLQQAAKVAGIDLDWDEVFWVSQAQFDRLDKKGQLPADQRLDNVVQKAVLAKANAAPLDEAHTLITVRQMVGTWNAALPVVMESFFSHVKITNDNANNAVYLAEIAGIDLRTRPIAAKIEAQIEELVQQYPLLFQKSDPDHYRKYITAIKASAEKEVVK